MFNSNLWSLTLISEKKESRKYFFFVKRLIKSDFISILYSYGDVNLRLFSILLKCGQFLQISFIYVVNFLFYTFFNLYFFYFKYFVCFIWCLIYYICKKKIIKFFLIQEFITDTFLASLQLINFNFSRFNLLHFKNRFSHAYFSIKRFPAYKFFKTRALPYSLKKRYYSVFLIPWFLRFRRLFYTSFFIKRNNVFITVFDGFGNKVQHLTKASLKDHSFRKRSPLIKELLVQELCFRVLPILLFFRKIYVSKSKRHLIRRVAKAVRVLAGQPTKFTVEYLKFLKDKYQIPFFHLAFKFKGKNSQYKTINYFVKKFNKRKNPIQFKFFLNNIPFNGCRLRKRRRL